MIDNRQLYEINRNKNAIIDNDVFLNTEIYYSILNQTASMYKENCQLLKK